MWYVCERIVKLNYGTVPVSNYSQILKVLWKIKSNLEKLIITQIESRKPQADK